MEIIKTNDFERSFKKLPADIQRIYKTQEKRFSANYKDNRLHIKKVRSLEYAMSFRITRNYRAFFYFQTPGRAIFFEIDHRKDIYR
ncbi:hypothetical protein FJ208_01420 [Candidatus Gribaldobacteria bacterium]|nr:hypothetical protein [Candidatus Gribaldobacteria bacterium]